MKTILLIITLFTFQFAFNQKATESIVIKTSADCGMCQDKIETELNYSKGVKFAEVDLETKQVTIKYYFCMAKVVTICQYFNLNIETG